MIETLWRNMRQAARSLRRDTGFAAFALLIAALGIAACTTIFSMINALSAFALLLAALGIYGLITYSVSQRTQEIGIRMALGAQASDIQRRILAETLTLTGIGLAIGLAASWAMASTLTALLYRVNSGDPVTFAAVIGLLLAIAALAGYLPSRRASHTDPASALRVT